MQESYIIALYDCIIEYYQDSPQSVYFSSELTPKELEKNIIQTYREWQSIIAHGNQVALLECYPGVLNQYTSTCKKTYISFSPANYPITYFLSAFIQAIHAEKRLFMFEEVVQNYLLEYRDILEVVERNAIRELTDLQNLNILDYPVLKVTATNCWFGEMTLGSWYAKTIYRTGPCMKYLVEKKLFKAWYQKYYSISNFKNTVKNGEYYIISRL